MELVRQRVMLNKDIGKEKSQVLLEGDIVVPDVKPDIASVLKADAEIVISKVKPMAGRVSYAGKLVIKMLYVANGEDAGAVHSIATTVAVDDFFNMEGVTLEPEVWVSLIADIANVEYRIINDRKLNYRVVVDIQVSACENVHVDIVKSIEGLPAAQQKTLVFNMSNLIEKKTDEFTIKDEVLIPGNRPAVREMLSCGVSISNKEVRFLNGRVDISGELVITPLYKGAREDSLIESAEFELPFSGSIDIGSQGDDSSQGTSGGTLGGMFGDAQLYILDSLIDVNPDENGEDRALAVEVLIGADINVLNSQELAVLEDAYCIDQALDITKEDMAYNHLVCRNKSQFNVKEVVTLEDAPEILQVVWVSGSLRLEERKVVDDKVVVEGIVMADVLYVANSDQAPIYNYKTVLPIRQVIETKGAKLGMEAVVTQSIDHIGFNMLSGKEVELRFVVSVDTLVQEDVKAQYITDIEFNPLDKDGLDMMPSMVILCVQKSDSLWSIAKKYNASLEELAFINDLDSNEELKDGQRLLIVKKVGADDFEDI